MGFRSTSQPGISSKGQVETLYFSSVGTHVGTPVSASCGISYSDGSVWRQTVTVTFDSHGSPVADWANLGAELVSPAGG